MAAASIRLYCWQRCYCASDTTRKSDNLTMPLWQFLISHNLVFLANGAAVLQASSASPSGSSPAASPRPTSNEAPIMTLLPAQHGNGSPSGTCGLAGDSFCPLQWNETMLGPIPRAPPNTTDLIAPPPPNTNASVCGNTCHSAADCASPQQQDNYGPDNSIGCRCALPTFEDARRLGLDPVSPIAICIALFQTIVSSSSKKHPPRRIDPTGEGIISGSTTSRPYSEKDESYSSAAVRYHDSDGNARTCRCNETYVADQCCLSTDGMVFRDQTAGIVS